MFLHKLNFIKLLIIFLLIGAFNVVTYLLTLSYLFSFEGNGPGILLKVFGLISIPFSYPTIFVQNILPLDGPQDTIVGIAVISVMETAILSWFLAFFRSRFR